MSNDQDAGAPSSIERLRAAAGAEKRLLKDEQRTERKVLRARERLAAAEDKLHKAQVRFDRRLEALGEAETALQAAQQRRAHGPETDDPENNQADESSGSEAQR